MCDVLSAVNRAEVKSSHKQAVPLVEQIHDIQTVVLSKVEIELQGASMSVSGKHTYAKENKRIKAEFQGNFNHSVCTAPLFSAQLT